MGSNRSATLRPWLIVVLALLAVISGNATTLAQSIPEPEVAIEVTPGPLANPSLENDLPASPASPTAPAPTYVEQMVVLVNQFRAENGLPPLKAVPELTKAAQDYVIRLAGANFFGHNDPDFACNKPSDRAVAVGYTNWTNIGENLAAGYSTAESAINAFKNSPGHRAAMLSPNFRDFGVGYFYDASDAANVRQDGSCPYGGSGGPYRYYWAQEFGSRYKDGSPHLPIIINAEAVSTTQRQVTIHVYGGIYGQTTWARQMRFSTDGTNWSAYEPWATSKTLSLPAGPGMKTVYAQITNGSSTQTVSDSIFLDEPFTPDPRMIVRAFVPIALR
jgi:uncharacterized protein YkwD